VPFRFGERHTRQSKACCVMATPIGCGKIYARSRDHLPALRKVGNRFSRCQSHSTAHMVGSCRTQFSFVGRSSEVQETDVSVADGDGHEGFRRCLWSHKWNCGHLDGYRVYRDSHSFRTYTKIAPVMPSQRGQSPSHGHYRAWAGTGVEGKQWP
jgi:hypothetical protein